MTDIFENAHLALALIGVVVLVFGGSAALVALLVRVTGDRWGSTPRHPVRVEAGAYRAVTLPQSRAPRGAPWAVRIGSYLGLVWAAVTAAGLAPAGLLLMFPASDWVDGSLGAFSAFALSLDGVLVSMAMIVGAVLLLTADAKRAPMAQICGFWAIAHHVLVLLVFAAWIPAARPYQGDAVTDIFVFSLTPCAIGIGIGILTLVGAQMLARWGIPAGEPARIEASARFVEPPWTTGSEPSRAL